MFQTVCRLCSGKQDLLCVFDEKISNNMTEIIKVTCGVEISKTDQITQMVCSTCCQVTIKMYQFRTKAIKNDTDLKARCAGYNIAQLTHAAANLNCKTESLPSVKPAIASVGSTPSSVSLTTPTNLPVAVKPKPQIPQKYKYAHPSIKNIVKKYPNLILPKSCLTSHVGAYITLLTDEVDEYYKEKEISDEEIEKIKQKAYELANPRKEITPKRKRKSSCEENHAYVISPTLSNVTKKAKMSNESKPKFRTNSETNGTKPKSISKTRKVENIACSDETNNTVKSIIEKNVVPEKNTRLTREKRLSTRSSTSSDGSKSAIPVKFNIEPVTKTKEKSISTVKSSDTSLINIKCDKKSNDILKNLLVHSHTPNRTKKDEITLKSLLYPKNVSNNEADVIEIDDPLPSFQVLSDNTNDSRSNSRSSEQPESAQNQKSSLRTEEEFEFFTSRPFVNELTEPKKASSKSDKENLLLSHNENVHEVNKNHKDVRNCDKNSEISSDSDPIVVDIDSRSSSSTKYSDQDKTSFAEALQLAPRISDNSSNMPDLSLVSVTTKSQTLYTCRVCDSQHSSRKEMKQHEKRTHTKCPFCNKRFRTLANRDEHVATTCSINKSPVKLKRPKLELIRVDEIQEIKRQYASAFVNSDEVDKDTTPCSSNKNAKTSLENEDNNEEPNKELELPITNQNKDPEVPIANTNKEVDVPITNKSKEIDVPVTNKNKERDVSIIIDLEETASENDPPVKCNPANTSKSDDSVVCDPATANAINELEKFLNYAEVIPVKDKSLGNTKQHISTGNEDIICISDEESDPPTITSRETDKQAEEGINVVNSEILNGINLHDNDFNVLKALLHQNKLRLALQKQLGGWNLSNNLIEDGSSNRVKIFRNLRKYLHHYKIPIEVKHSPTISVQYKPRTQLPPKKLAGLWGTLKPETLKAARVPVPTPIPPKTQTYRLLNGQLNMFPSLNQPSSSQPIRQNVIINSTSSQVPNMTTVQNNDVTTTNLILAPVSVATSSNSPSASIVLGGSRINSQLLTSTAQMPGASTSAIPSSSKNPTQRYLLLAPTLLSQAALPALQGPLPVIESVVSSAKEVSSSEEPSVTTVQQLESITNSLMPTPTTSHTTKNGVVSVANVQSSESGIVDAEQTNHQPAIRVRNLKELS